MATINGTINDDTLKGGAGNDIITGGLGNDLAWMGGGNDVFIWNAGGDGNDTVEGQAGFDTLRFFADSKDEVIEISANGARTKIHRDVGDVTLDLNDVERIDIRARGGADIIRVQDLTGTDVKQVAIDLAGAVSGTPDGGNDSVEVYGTNGNDIVTVASAGSKVTVTGLAAQVTISNPDSDWLVIKTGKGNDIINASKLDLMGRSLNGDEGNDRITGTKGNDYLNGGEGNDTIVGGGGNDYVVLDNGDDLFLWYAGDGKDTVYCGTGTDTVRVTGSNAGEILGVSTDLGNMVASYNGATSVVADYVARLQIRALGGADRIDLFDLTDSHVRQVAVDLAATAGGTLADASVDSVNVGGTLTDDIIDIGWTGSGVRVTGLAARIDITHAGATDILSIYGDNGNDTILAGSMPGGKMRLQLNGGAGDDVIMGSAGNDTLIGGAGNDVAFLGAGNDQFIWNAGDGNDKIDGQAGIDTLVVRGSPANDAFEVRGNDSNQAVFVSGSTTLTSDDVERFQLSTYNGQDYVQIDQYTLANTTLTQVAIDLGQGAADGEADAVVVNGTFGDDQVTIAMAGSVVSVTGLHAQVSIAHADSQDLLSISSYGGDDVIDAASLAAGIMQLKLEGGSGNNTITGSAGNDTLYGWDGKDVLRGGAGADTILGGNDSDSLVGGAGADSLDGGDGDDVIIGGRGDDVILGGSGGDTFRYTSVLDGHDVISDFDGDATGGQDTFKLDALFDALGIANGARAGRVEITDNGGTVDIRVNADGISGNGFELHVATLNTVDQITVGQDVILT
jgi:Ca2+-binding RTX toxin-like protein